MSVNFNSIRVPDFWQARVVAALKEGRDVVLHAPTGAGKTYAFELFYQRHFEGRAVFTVPTRALANDKFREWSSLGWNVGIATGDYSRNTSAPLVVATLETQKFGILEGIAPDLLAVDEYQLLADPARGANYEIAIAALPQTCRLLLLSGSVENAPDVAAWLGRIGRDAVLISHDERPVPLEEVFSEAICGDVSFSAGGAWGRLVKKMVDLDMAPVLIFAPKRIDAEIIAGRIASELPKDVLDLPREKLSRAGRRLGGLLRRRVAFHHSGLSAYQRANLVEELAKRGELTAVVATTGLGAGVNFSMRSVIIADREYESRGGVFTLRPDEILQMYGRAGRRGLDASGYAVCLPSKPRLSDASRAVLRRPKNLDWAAIIRVMALAAKSGANPKLAAERLCSRLFTEEKIDLGFSGVPQNSAQNRGGLRSGSKIEIQNSAGFWERKGASSPAKLKDALYFDGKAWRSFLSVKKAVLGLKIGAATKLDSGLWGLKIRVASAAEIGGFFRLNKGIIRRVKGVVAACDRSILSKSGATLKSLKRHFLKYAPLCFWNCQALSLEVSGGGVFADLDLSNLLIGAFKDSEGAFLANPPERLSCLENANDFEALCGLRGAGNLSRPPALRWLDFGLVDRGFNPTVRGEIFSLFSGAEGLAVAAALEESSYSISEIYYDISNLRAGARFEKYSKSRSVSTRLGDVCRLRFGVSDLPSYLSKGLPLGYGNGASEIVRKIDAGKSFAELEDDVLRRGDIERAYLEWRSLVRHIAACPDVDSDRFMELKRFCEARV